MSFYLKLWPGYGIRGSLSHSLYFFPVCLLADPASEPQHTGSSDDRLAARLASRSTMPSSTKRESLCLLCVPTMSELIWAKYSHRTEAGRGALPQRPCFCSPAPSISVCLVVSSCTTFSWSSSDGHHFSSGLSSHTCSPSLQWTLWTWFMGHLWIVSNTRGKHCTANYNYNNVFPVTECYISTVFQCCFILLLHVVQNEKESAGMTSFFSVHPKLLQVWQLAQNQLVQISGNMVLLKISTLFRLEEFQKIRWLSVGNRKQITSSVLKSTVLLTLLSISTSSLHGLYYSKQWIDWLEVFVTWT